MSLPRGRILRGSTGARAFPGGTSLAVPLGGRVVKRVVAEAALFAAERLASAEGRARDILVEAEQAARRMHERTKEQVQQEAAAQLASAWIRFRAEEAARDEKSLDRIVELARAIAERIIGETLRLDGAAILSVARQVLASARQAKRITFRAHPDDAELLRREIASLGLEGVAVEIHADDARPRGSLLLDTDLGILDANLSVALDRLTRALRDSLRS
jgi:flagellar biosynthesis/type III secretory pathway protein FliH